jgi:organic hydroperoxide reductase OsmC/OhrA
MNEDAFNMSVRHFLKKVGITSQREIEKAVREAIADGRISDGGKLTAVVRLEVDGVDLEHTIEGVIELE